jgi:soluble lytic murein transglycosylase-like protein
MNPRTLARLLPLGIALLTVVGICAATGSVEPVPARFQEKETPKEMQKAPGLASLFTPQVLAWEGEILRWSEEFSLDPNLAATVMQIESCGNPQAVSRSGAQGLFQVMPFHFAAEEDMQDPETNARRGLTYLVEALLLAEGDVRRALAGYNGGHGVIGWNEADWPEETRRYAYWGEGIYSDAAAGDSFSPRLNEWLAAGGTSLCEVAPF